MFPTLSLAIAPAIVINSNKEECARAQKPPFSRTGFCGHSCPYAIFLGGKQ